MPLPKTNPSRTSAWVNLQDHFKEIEGTHISDHFSNDSSRAENLSIQWNDFLIDYSKNRITQKTLDLLVALAEEVKLPEAINSYFGGEAINETEGRAVMHTALRSNAKEIFVDGQNIMEEVAEVKQKMKGFCDAIISGKKKGFTGKAFTDVVNIGIGGSDLGPVMVAEALKFYGNHLNVHFVSNVDGDHVSEIIKGLNPETTLFVVVSKTFTTQETLTNAEALKSWFLEHASENDIAKHFAAVSTNLEQINAFGIAQENVFPMWDWVGGRFSLWSAVGLSIALAVGYDHFASMLDGARMMDDHFKKAPLDKNIPAVLALISIWYNNFYGAETEAIIPYNQYLHRLSAYLQQAVMESNGKSVDRSGNTVGYQTGTIIWGETGTNSQHAFFQLIHQGTKPIPTDFIGFKKSLHGNTESHNKLMANFFAQTEALMKGKSKDEVVQELESSGKNQGEIEKLTPFKIFEGNKPTNTILIDKLTPGSLGSLIAMYEHKIFVQGVIWNIFSYDQWGVELGKVLAKNILKDIDGQSAGEHDPSTTRLLSHYLS